MVEQAKFTYSPLGKTFQKQIKANEERGEKQIKALEEHGKQLLNLAVKKASFETKKLLLKQKDFLNNLLMKRWVKFKI